MIIPFAFGMVKEAVTAAIVVAVGLEDEVEVALASSSSFYPLAGNVGSDTIYFLIPLSRLSDLDTLLLGSIFDCRALVLRELLQMRFDVFIDFNNS